MPEKSDDQYFARIEEHFGRRRGGPLVLSPKDWRLLEEWQQSGIPLRVVLRGINHAFDRFAASGPRPDRINSLRYCEQEVQAAWQDYRATPRHSDDAPSATLPTASAHLRAVCSACRSAARTATEKALVAPLTAAADALEELESRVQAGELRPREIDRTATELQQRLTDELDALRDRPTLENLGIPSFSPYDV